MDAELEVAEQGLAACAKAGRKAEEEASRLADE